MKNFLQNNVTKMIVALAVVGAVSGLSLVFVYKYAMPKIKININKEMDKAIKSIFPGTDKTEKIEGQQDVFKVRDKKGILLGYAFVAEGNGYQGIIKIIVGVDEKIIKTKGMEVLESQETPGLGAEIANGKFKDQFKGLSIVQAIEYVKNQNPQKPYEIEAITGATISSRAVVNIINKKLAEIREALRK
ncbi:MAG: FMN-binding protein [Candidatus Omnitrophota bacterium]